MIKRLADELSLAHSGVASQDATSNDWNLIHTKLIPILKNSTTINNIGMNPKPETPMFHLGRASDTSYYQRCFSSAIIHDFLYRQLVPHKRINVIHPFSVYIGTNMEPIKMEKKTSNGIRVLYNYLWKAIEKSSGIRIDSHTTFRKKCMVAKLVFLEMGIILQQLHPTMKLNISNGSSFSLLFISYLPHFSRLLNTFPRVVLSNGNELKRVMTISSLKAAIDGVPIPDYKNGNGKKNQKKNPEKKLQQPKKRIMHQGKKKSPPEHSLEDNIPRRPHLIEFKKTGC